MDERRRLERAHDMLVQVLDGTPFPFTEPGLWLEVMKCLSKADRLKISILCKGMLVSVSNTIITLEKKSSFPHTEFLGLPKWINILNRFQKLEVVSLIHNTTLSDDAIVAVIKNCKRLTKLNVKGCKQLTDTTFLEVAKNCSGLPTLIVHCCYQMTDTALMAVAKQCPKLTNLDVGECIQLTDTSLVVVAENCIKLDTLNVQWCKNLTDTALIEITNYCALDALYATGCYNLTDAALMAVAKHCKGLTRLNVAGC